MLSILILMAHFNIEGLLKDIQSEDEETMYISVTHKAEEWAAAGFMEGSNQLLAALWSYGIGHSGHLWVPDQGFQIMWEVGGKRPSKAPFAFASLDEIETVNRESVILRVGVVPGMENYLEKPIDSLTGGQLLGKAHHAAYEDSEPVPVILAGLERFLETEEAVGHAYFSAATLGAYLAAHSGRGAQAEGFIRLWGQGYLKWPQNYTLAYLMRDRATARYLLQGILAPVFGFTVERVQKDLALICAALAERMRKGRTLPYGHLSWQELLLSISTMAIKQKTNRFRESSIASGWLGRKGASPEAIRKAEKALGVTLPQDYKEFLLVSNGFEALTIAGASLVPVAQINHFASADPAFVEDWIDAVWADDETAASRFRKSIIIGGFGEEQQVLLVPGGSGGWECWFFASWNLGESRYPSFRFYMERQLQDLEEGIFAAQ